MIPLAQIVDLLRCPLSGEALKIGNGELMGETARYPIPDDGVVAFAAQPDNRDAVRQQSHYDSVAANYVANLGYPHTQEYLEYMDQVLFKTIGDQPLGDMAEICCGRGEAVRILNGRFARGVGIDISLEMLRVGATDDPGDRVILLQGDATRLPLADQSFDTVLMLGGIHHVLDRRRLFEEVERILKPGGRFIFREPVSDFFLWRWIRAVIYRLSPSLDHETERPLLIEETNPVLEAAGLQPTTWKTIGFFGFCLFMNSDVLVFNRLFRFIPGIRPLTRAFAAMDDWITGLRMLRNSGLIVIGLAEKPVPSSAEG